MKNSVDNPTNPVDNLEILAKNKPQAITAPGIIAHNRWRADTTGIVKTGEPVIFPIKGQCQAPAPQSFAAVLGIKNRQVSSMNNWHKTKGPCQQPDTNASN